MWTVLLNQGSHKVDKAKSSVFDDLNERSVCVPWEHVEYRSAHKEEYIAEEIVLVIDVLSWCGHPGFQTRADPWNEKLGFSLQETNLLDQLLVDDFWERTAQVERQVFDKVCHRLFVVAIVEIDVSFDFNVQFTLYMMLVCQFVEHSHFRLVCNWSLFLLTDEVCEGSACQGKGNDASEHDEDANDLLGEGRDRHVAIAHGRNGRHREVECSQVKLSFIQALVARSPCLRLVFLQEADNKPDTCDYMRRHRKETEELEQPFEIFSNVERFLNERYNAESAGLLKFHQS